jgi:dipeptide/tripeptide permease
MKELLELQLSLWRNSNFKTYTIFIFSFFFWTLYKEGGVVIQFHIKKIVHMGWANEKVQPKTKNKIMHIF